MPTESTPAPRWTLDHDPAPAEGNRGATLDEALVGFADSNRDLFREYVEGWYDAERAAAILEEWGD